MIDAAPTCCASLRSPASSALSFVAHPVLRQAHAARARRDRHRRRRHRAFVLSLGAAASSGSSTSTTRTRGRRTPRGRSAVSTARRQAPPPRRRGTPTAEDGRRRPGRRRGTTARPAVEEPPAPRREARRGRRGRGEEHHAVAAGRHASTTWFTDRRPSTFKVGTLVDGLSGDDAARRHASSRCWCTSTRTDYVGGDRRYTHYFAFLSLFTASMLLLRHGRRTRCSSSPAGSWSASARSRSSATGGRRNPTPTPPSRRSSPTASATSAC